MIKVKRLGIQKKIAINPFIPDILYKRDYSNEDGYEETTEEREIQNFKKPVRVFLNEKLEKSILDDTIISQEMNKYIISEHDEELKQGMIFTYYGVKYEVVVPVPQIKYGGIFCWIAELKEI